MRISAAAAAAAVVGLVVLACADGCAVGPHWDGSAPEPVSPASGTTFDHYPRHTELKWHPVPGSVAYAVDIDCFHCCDLGKWCTNVGKPRFMGQDVRATSYRFVWVGANWGRWRVWAIAPDGAAGRKSEWQEFLYTR